MKKQDFQFELPSELIANHPSPDRSASRLMVLDPVSESISHRRFFDLINTLDEKDCLIFNNTKVIPARLWGKRESGGKVEILLERFIAKGQQECCLAQIRASNSPKAGAIIQVGKHRLEVIGREARFYQLKNLGETPLAVIFEEEGEMPLPPYIERAAESEDNERYQTVYAKEKGAVAAPTAGLHFDLPLLKAIEDKGIESGFVTLHVGAGTYSPVRVEDIREHQMHSEYFEVPESVVSLVTRTHQNGGRVIAVGTTSVRCLESAAKSGVLAPYKGETDIFIYPGYRFQVVDALITNFHLSESTLLMLVGAFAGREFILEAYAEAVSQQYRFFSYGDSMLIERKLDTDKNE